MRHILITILSILLLSSPVIGQSEKPQTIIIPTGSLGEMSKVRIGILEKTLESKLDDYFAIVPKELFEEAQEQAFQEMDSDECTEDQCILMIKEILQIENAFKMDLIIDEGDTQISITWNDQDQKRVEEDYCEGCKTKGLRLMIGGLVKKLVGVKESAKEVEPVLVEKQNVGSDVCKSVCEDLVGFYPFNGNAKDFSGNGNHGDVYFAKLTSDSKDIKGSAYLFDGESSYIEIPNAVKNTSYSLTAYVKVNKFIEVTKVDCPNGGGSRAGIITFAGEGLQLMNCSGWSRQTSFPDNFYKLWFQIHSFCSTDNCVMEDQSFSRNNAIQIGKYYLFTISINKETGIASLYQDTKLIDKKRWEFNLGNRFYIGIMDKNNLMKPGALSGVIDEIRIYNKALNDIEVKEIYESLR